VLRYAKHGEVLEFRRKIAGSALLAEAFDSLRPLVAPLYARYARDPKAAMGAMASPAKGVAVTAALTAATGTLSLKRFLDMCQDAALIGSQLSRNSVKMAFVNSLKFSADAAAVRQPLLSGGGEFEEALMRLAHAYVAAGDGAGASTLTEPVGNPKKGRAQNRFSNFSAVSAAVSTVSAAVKFTMSARRGGEADSTDADIAQLEEALLSKLPVVLGKLLATLTDDRPAGLSA
jgi:hypothetical protein